MNEATLGILLEMKDTATPQLRGFGNQVTDTMAKNRMAIRELAMGVMFLGSTFVSLGASMRMSNNESIKNIGNVIMLSGAIMTAIGSAVQFISAISKVIDALKKLQVAQILAQAFAGPTGWAALAVGGAIAAGAVYGVSRYEKAEKATTVNVHVAGSVVTERQLTDSIHRSLLLKEQRSSTTGIH